MSRGVVGIALVLAWSAVGRARAEEPGPAVSVRLVRPDRQVERVLKLFEGARAPHPAAALAAWRRATGDHLGKPIEAAIAAFNPEMARELRSFDGAEALVGFDPADGRLRWRARAPRDDGTLAALATALALTGGAPEEPLGDAAVDRLGPPGAPLVARGDRGVVAAGSREDLRTALMPGDAADQPPEGIDSGWIVSIDPEALGAPGSTDRRRVAGALKALGCDRLEGVARLEGETLSLVVTGRFAEPPSAGGPIDPGWLDWIPRSKTLASACWSIDPSRAAWDSAFAVLDRIEKADPAREKAGPLRARVGLIAMAAGVRPEVELWPKLRGATLAARADGGGRIDGALLALHVVDEPAAERLERVVLPRLAVAFRPVKPAQAAPGEAGPTRPLGKLSGRPLDAARRGTTVLIGWGERALDEGLDARDHPERSAGPLLRDGWAGDPPPRSGAFWPGRLGGLGARLSATLDEGPPVRWSGRRDGDATRDEVRWAGLDAAVRRFLDRLPMAPAD